MYIPKRYGESGINNCPFCGKISVTKNIQGVPVCKMHKNENLDDLKCVCGEYLDILEGKWGPYFRCMNCGNINFKKGLEMNPQVKSNQEHDNRQGSKQASGKEITVTSDQIDFMY